MFVSFTYWLLRKHSSIQKLGLVKHGRFCDDTVFRYFGQHTSIISGHRKLGTSTINWPTVQPYKLFCKGRRHAPDSMICNCRHEVWSHKFEHISRRHIYRSFSNWSNRYQQKNRTTAIYTVALVVVVLGASYAAVPLYRIFCQASGLGGTVQQAESGEKIKNMTTRKERLLTVRFNADKSATMQWSFKPQQSEVKVYPGETALAFYTAKNPTGVPITGISTYNVIPFEAGQYFNKIQCFCFEEQRLNPHEQVDMPVFFYIDPEFLDDPALYKVDTITLSYTFFQSKEAHELGIQ